MAQARSLGLRLATNIGLFLDYTYMLGVLLSCVFLIVLVKGLFNKNNLLRSPFYFFVTVATASDICSCSLFYIVAYILEPLFGGNSNVRTQKAYHDYIYLVIIFISRILLIMDMILDGVLTFNRFTAFIFPFQHKKVRLL